MVYTHHYESPLGGITMAGDGNALTGRWLDGTGSFGETLSAGYRDRRLPVFDETDRWLDIYFSGGIPDFTPAMNIRATAFRKTVWETLRSIPYGRTATYGRIAEQAAGQAGVPRMSARAVGGAVGHNPILLIIPCHRVVGAGGKLTGYSGGIERKAALLRMEGQAEAARNELTFISPDNIIFTTDE